MRNTKTGKDGPPACITCFIAQLQCQFRWSTLKNETYMKLSPSYEAGRPESITRILSFLVADHPGAISRGSADRERYLLDLGSPPVLTYDVAPDGKHFAVVLYADGTAEEKPITHVTFLLNFFDELRRRVPLGKD